MSNPWEEYQPGQFNIEPAAPPPAQLPQEEGPWVEYAGASSEDRTFRGHATTNPVQFRQELEQMLRSGAPRADVDQFVYNSGYELTPEVSQWMDENYGDYEGTQSEEFDVAEPTQRQGAGNFDAWWSGTQSGALRGWDDEWKAFWGATGNSLGTLLGLNESTASFGDIYDILQARNQAEKEHAFETNPIAYGFGFVPGSLTGPSYFRSPAATTRGRVRQAATVGGIEGTLSGAGNSEDGLGDRLTGAALGGTIGAGAGAVLYPVVAGGQSLFSRARERVLPDNSLNSGLEVLARRAPQNADTMTGRVADMQAAGVEPRLVDVIDEGGRGVVRAAAGRGEAREEVARHADQVYTDVQDRVAQQARDVISDNPRTARQLGDAIAQEQANLGPQFDAVRDEVVQLTPEVIQALTTREGLTALRQISRYLPPERAGQLNDFVRNLAAASKVDPRMPPQVRDQIMQQLMRGSPFTVDIADKFTRFMTRRAGDNPAMQNAVRAYNETIRGAARQQHPAYDEALNQFARQAQVGEAAAGTGRFAETDFMNTPPDVYGRAVNEANRTGTPVNVGDDVRVYPSEYSAMRDRARDQIVDRATSGSGAQAAGVARQIARGTAQGERNAALLGTDDAQRLQAGMREEVTRLDNTRFIDPRTGSQTQGRTADEAALDAGFNFGADVATSGKWGIVRGVSRWLRGAGIRNVDAERLVRDAIDPKRTQAAVEYLVERGVEIDRARGLVRQIVSTQAGRAVGSAVGSEEPAPRVRGSVRSIMRNEQEIQQ